MKKNKTYKKLHFRKKGGDIDNRNGLKYILSIGYEMESGNLSKLTKTDVVDNPDDIILYNTDTARKDILTFKQLSESEEFDILDDELISRMEEIVEEDAYDDNNQIDKNIIFNITSDISETTFTKRLDKICDGTANVNDLYFFRTLYGEKYNINFIFREPKACDIWSGVEWLFTYLKPEQGPNIIVNTYTNALSNLIRHLSDLEEIEGNLIMNTEHGEFILDKPDIRSLYHKPNTNLHYLQTHLLDKKLTIDDVCFTSQMTFSCNVENILIVMKTLIKDNHNLIERIHDDSEHKYSVLENLEICIQKLIESYNLKNETFKLIITKNNAKIMKKFIGYLALFMFKLSRFYNHFLMKPVEKRKYLKDSLFFNARHGNYNLYKEMKQKLKQIFGPQLGNDEVNANNILANIIQKLIIQPEVLNQYFIAPSTKVRKNVFSPNNLLVKNERRYGDPEFSLISYLKFFEDPSDFEENNYEGQIIYYDWLEFDKIDLFSTKMDLVDDIVLIEYRGFQKMLSNYVFSVADETLKNMMRNGTCNILAKKYSEDVGALSIGIAKRLLELTGKIGGKKNNRTRKIRRTRKY
jgi:hypothetical protein